MISYQYHLFSSMQHR